MDCYYSRTTLYNRSRLITPRDHRETGIPPSTSRQHGTILIEVLIAGLILTIGIGSLATAQQHTLKTTTSAEIVTRLISLHGTVIDRLRLNPEAVTNGTFNIELPYSDSVNSVISRVPLLADISAALDHTGAEGYLKVDCLKSDNLHCDICVGVFQSTVNTDKTEQDQLPLTRLCSRQRIL